MIELKLKYIEKSKLGFRDMKIMSRRYGQRVRKTLGSMMRAVQYNLKQRINSRIFSPSRLTGVAPVSVNVVNNGRYHSRYCSQEHFSTKRQQC